MRRTANPASHQRFPGPVFLALLFFLCVGCRSKHADSVKRFAPKAHSVVLSWSRGKSPSFRYNVYRESSLGGPAQKLNNEPLDGVEYRDATAEAGQSYKYYVTAVNFRGKESGPSELVLATVPSP